MKDLFRENRYFLIPYFFFLLAGGIILLLFEKRELHLSLNNFFHPVLDIFFKYLTYLGDGLVVAIFILILLFIKIRHSIILLSGYAVSALVTQGMKHLIFEHNPRPVKFFEELGESLRTIPGVTAHHWNSFPSGHSSAAFTLFFCLGLFTEKHWLKFFFFVLSLLVGYSRVYLSQHFFADIYAGSVVGVITSMMVWFFFERRKALHHPRFESGILNKI